MKTHVQKIEADATLRQALDLMDLYQTDLLPVVDADGRAVGVLTEGDIARALQIANSSIESSSFSAWRAAGDMMVGEAMTRPARVVGEYEPVAAALLRMLDGEAKRLPVVSEDGRVIGVLHRTDALQALFEGDL